MNKKITQLRKSYEKALEEINKQTEDKEEIEWEIRRLNSRLVSAIKHSDLKDNEKEALIELFQEERNKVEIIITLQDDQQKIRYLRQIQNKSLKEDIIRSFQEDKNKVKYLQECGERARIEILFSLKDENLLRKIIEDNEATKKETIKYLYTNMKYRIKEEQWDIMKKLGLEKQVIPHILANTKYKIIEEMTERQKMMLKNT